MPKPIGLFIAPILLALFVLITATANGATLYKDYVVRYDRGWDILCDPYQVQQGDWVLKIFRKKGEISHYDFRDFLGIFQRLNPHINDIDRIRPGQVVDIPLKKLTKGTLPGQSSGMVTIPFILISSPREKVEKSSRTYVIQKGDTVSILIAKKFGGRYGSDTFRQGLSLFKAINPHIKDIHRIYAGQNVYMPDPSLREKSWYSSLFNENGDLVKQFSDENDLEKTSSDEEEKRPQPALPDTPEDVEPIPVKNDQDEEKPAEATAQTMNGRYLDKGTLYLPRKKNQDFEIDLSRYPMIDFGHGEKVILTTQDKVMDVDLPLVQSYWDKVKIVKISEGASSRNIMESVLDAFSGETAMDQLAFEDTGVAIQVKAQWIRSHPSPDGQSLEHTCITLIASDKEKTHEAIVRYLEQNDIKIKDVLSTAQPLQPSSEKSMTKVKTQRIDFTTANDFIVEFSRMMGFTYAPNTPISFPYAGVQVEARSNFLSFGNGKQVLVDFGDLYGDAGKAIEATGIDIIKFSTKAESYDMINRLMEAGALDTTDSPAFYGADRSHEFNTTLTVDGILVRNKSGQEQLFMEKPLPDQIERFIRVKGIQPIIIKRSTAE